MAKKKALNDDSILENTLKRSRSGRIIVKPKHKMEFMEKKNLAANASNNVRNESNKENVPTFNSVVIPSPLRNVKFRTRNGTKTANIVPEKITEIGQTKVGIKSKMKLNDTTKKHKNKQPTIKVNKAPSISATTQTIVNETENPPVSEQKRSVGVRRLVNNEIISATSVQISGNSEDTETKIPAVKSKSVVTHRSSSRYIKPRLRKGPKTGNIIDKLISAKIASKVEIKIQKKLNVTTEEYNKSIFHKSRPRLKRKTAKPTITPIHLNSRCSIVLRRLTDAEIKLATREPLPLETTLFPHLNNRCSIILQRLTDEEIMLASRDTLPLEKNHLHIQTNKKILNANRKLNPRKKLQLVETPETVTADVYDFSKNAVSESSSEDIQMKEVLERLKQKIKKKRYVKKKKNPTKMNNNQRQKKIGTIVISDTEVNPAVVDKPIENSIFVVEDVFDHDDEDHVYEETETADEPVPMNAETHKDILSPKQNSTIEQTSGKCIQITKITQPLDKNQTIQQSRKSASKPSPCPPKSPWRLNEDEIILPRTFYFARGKDNTPTYSSDVMPEDDRFPAVKKAATASTVESQSSLNNSDIENIVPPQYQKHKAHQSKPPGTRSPLKIIDIRNISLFSPLATNSISVQDASAVSRNFTKSFASPQNSISSNETTEAISKKVDYFGFETFIDDNGEDEHGAVVDTAVINKTILLTKKAAKANLNKVKGLMRKDQHHQRAVPHTPSSTVFRSPVKQRDLKALLLSGKVNRNASTPILSKKPLHRIANLKNFASNPLDSPGDISIIEKDDVNSTNAVPEDSLVQHLFDEVGPEIDVNKGNQHRKSYTRIPRRKRPRNIYYQELGLSDSESEFESDAETIEEPIPKKRRQQTKRKNNPEETIEFKKFVSEFNSMCDEVNQYNLIVEKV